MKETVSEFLARGGQIKQLKPYIPAPRGCRFQTHERVITQAVQALKDGNLDKALEIIRGK